MTPTPHFPPAALTFLRGLARHNDRPWFDERKATYESALKAPMLAVIEAINDGLADFAPGHIRPPQKIFMRIYRDTRFSPNKLPYKTHVAAWWARQGLEKTSGGGFYLEFGPDTKEGPGITLAGGAYMPERDQLLAIRRHLLTHHAEYGRIMAAKPLRTAMQPLEPLLLTRPPKGFPELTDDHPARPLILQRQWGVSTHLPAALGLGPDLVQTALHHFQLAAPLVHLLNEPLGRPTPKPFF